MREREIQPDLLTMDEAAAKLRVCRKTLMFHIRRGDLPFVVLGQDLKRPKRMFHPADLVAFIDRQRRTEACQSTSQRERNTTSSTSNIEAIDFAALRAQRRGEKQKPSSGKGKPRPRAKQNVVPLRSESR